MRVWFVCIATSLQCVGCIVVFYQPRHTPVAPPHPPASHTHFVLQYLLIYKLNTLFNPPFILMWSNHLESQADVCVTWVCTASASPADAARVHRISIDQPRRQSVTSLVPLNKQQYWQSHSHILPLEANAAIGWTTVGEAMAALDCFLDNAAEIDWFTGLSFIYLLFPLESWFHGSVFGFVLIPPPRFHRYFSPALLCRPRSLICRHWHVGVDVWMLPLIVFGFVFFCDW